MNSFFRNLSLIFAAGAFGGLVKALVAWSFGATGINAFLGSTMAMPLTPMWIYQHMIWGGIWACLFFLPLRWSYLITFFGVIWGLTTAYWLKLSREGR